MAGRWGGSQETGDQGGVYETDSTLLEDEDSPDREQGNCL